MKPGQIHRIGKSWDQIRLAMGLVRKAGFPALAVGVFDLLTRIPIVATPLLWKWILDNFFGPRDPAVMAKATALYLLSGAALFVFGTAGAIVASVTAERASRILRERLFSQLDWQRPETFASDDSGRILSCFTNDLPGAESMLGGAFLSILVSLTDCILIVAIIAWLHPPLLLVCLALSPVLFGILLITNRQLRKASHRLQERQSRVMSTLSDLVEGRGDLIALGGLDKTFHPRFRTAYTDRFRALLRMNFTSAFTRGFVHFAFWATALTILYLGFGMVLKGTISIGTAFAITELFLGLGFEARNLYQNNQTIQVGLASLERISNRFSNTVTAPAEILESATALPNPVPAARNQPHRLPTDSPEADFTAERLTLVNIRFRYPGGKEVLRGIDLSLSEGVTAVVGPSGAGKTTLAMIAAAGFTPTSGTLLIEGRSLQEWNLDRLRSHIGLLRQAPHVFDCTLRENLHLALPHATDEAMLEALELAELGDLVPSLPKGLDTPLGNRGQTLSEGQRQRLALARLYLRRPALWILDEPTSSLDRETEQKVLARLKDHLNGRPALIVTHSQDIVRMAKQVFKMKQGRLIPHTLPDRESHERIEIGS